MIPQTNSQLYRFALKESICDLVHLQQTYDPSDEVFWAFFNARVLLNQPLNVDDFVRDAYVFGSPYGTRTTTDVE
jgi:hypothetical protein